MVGRLVEHQQVGPAGHQQRQVGPGPLAGRQRADRAQHVVRAEAELREQGARLRLVLTGRAPGTPRPGVVAGSKVRRTWSTSPTTTLRPSQARPEVSGSRPSSAASRVDLPEPLGPVTATRSPRRTARSTGPSRKPPRSTTAAASPATSSGPRVAGSSASRSSHGSRGSSTSSSRSSWREPARRPPPRDCAPASLGRPDVLVRLGRPRPARWSRRAWPCRAHSFSRRARSSQCRALLVVGLVGRLRGGPGPLALLEVGREAAAEHACPGG